MYVYPTMNACPYTSNPHLSQQSVRMDLFILGTRTEHSVESRLLKDPQRDMDPWIHQSSTIRAVLFP